MNIGKNSNSLGEYDAEDFPTPRVPWWRFGTHPIQASADSGMI